MKRPREKPACQLVRKKRPSELVTGPSVPSYARDVVLVLVRPAEAGALGLNNVLGPEFFEWPPVGRSIARAIRMDEVPISSVPIAEIALVRRRPRNSGLRTGSQHAGPGRPLGQAAAGFLAKLEVTELRDGAEFAISRTNDGSLRR